MKYILATLLILLTSTIYASQKAITDTGEEVILYTDGTWEYSNKTNRPISEITTNPNAFEKPNNSTFMLKSTINSSTFWIDPNSWSFNKAEGSDAAEYEFHLKGSDLYAMSISEGLSMPVETLTNIALENAKNVAPDVMIIKQEYRMVNGLKVIYMEMRGTMDGFDFTYLGYYHSDKSGSTQFVTYTGSSVVEKYTTEISNFLNGLGVQ